MNINFIHELINIWSKLSGNALNLSISTTEISPNLHQEFPTKDPNLNPIYLGQIPTKAYMGDKRVCGIRAIIKSSSWTEWTSIQIDVHQIIN